MAFFRHSANKTHKDIESFDSNQYCTKKYTLSKQNTVLTETKDSAGCAYLIKIARWGVHKWKFKILKGNDNAWFMTIGVWKTNHALKPEQTSYGQEKILMVGLLIISKQHLVTQSNELMARKYVLLEI